jgi:hypothetical protein
MTPMLKQLKLNVHGSTALMFGFWVLRMLRLVTAHSYKCKDGVLNNDAEDAHLHTHVLSLSVYASVSLLCVLFLILPNFPPKLILTSKWYLSHAK